MSGVSYKEALRSILYNAPHSTPPDLIVDVEVARDIAARVLERCRGLGCVKAANTLLFAALIVLADSTAGMVESIDVVARRLKGVLGGGPIAGRGDWAREAGGGPGKEAASGEAGVGGEGMAGSERAGGREGAQVA